MDRKRLPGAGGALIGILVASLARAGEEPLHIEGDITSFLARDRDGDGLVEIWVSYHAGGQRFIGLFRGGASYSRSPDTVVPVDPQAVLFALGEQDPEPGLDLILISRSSGVIYPLGGEGIRKLFAAELFFTMPGTTATPAWLSEEKIDVDRDGLDDIVLPEKRRLRILYGAPEPADARPIQGPAPGPEKRASELPISYYLLSDTREEKIRVVVEDFLEEDKSPAPFMDSAGAYPFPLLADFDGDGLTDVIVKQLGQRLEVFRQEAPGKFPPAPHLKVDIPWSKDVTSYQILDLNGDRKLDGVASGLILKDLVTEVKVFLQDPEQPGWGFSKPKQVLRVQGLFARPDIADADGDGLLDLLVSTYRVDLLDKLKPSAVEEIEIHHEVFRGTSGALFERRPGFQQSFLLKTKDLDPESSKRFIHAGRDLSGDGRTDLLFVDSGQSLRLYRGVSGKALRYDEDTAFRERIEYPRDVKIVDLDPRAGAEVILRYERRLEVHRPAGRTGR